MSSTEKGNVSSWTSFFLLDHLSVQLQRANTAWAIPFLFPAALHAQCWLRIHPCQGYTSVPLPCLFFKPPPVATNPKTEDSGSSQQDYRRCSTTLSGCLSWVQPFEQKKLPLLQKIPWSMLLEVSHLPRAPSPECLFCPTTSWPVPCCSEFHFLLLFERG